jgi:c-di-GMP-binding flagellar brake protein YcgR
VAAFAPAAPSIPTLRIGQTCDVTIEAAQGGGQYKSRIEDVEGAVVKVAMPSRQGQLVVPPMGQAVQLTVQATGGGTLFVQAEVTGRQNQPFPTLTLRVLSASQQQARSYFRADVTIWPSECSVWGAAPEHDAHDAHAGHDPDPEHPSHPAHPNHAEHLAGVASLAFWRPLKASLHDLSGGGAALLTGEHLRVGDRVRLRFPLPHGGGEVAVTGEVRRSIGRGPDPQGQPRWDIGVAFDTLKAETRDGVVKAVNRAQAEERRRQAG